MAARGGPRVVEIGEFVAHSARGQQHDARIGASHGFGHDVAHLEEMPELRGLAGADAQDLLARAQQMHDVDRGIVQRQRRLGDLRDR